MTLNKNIGLYKKNNTAGTVSGGIVFCEKIVILKK